MLLDSMQAGVEPELDAEGNPVLLRGEDDWLPLLPSIGVLYEF